MRPLLALLKGEGKGDDVPEGPRYQLIVDVIVDDEDELEQFVDAMHRRWFTDEHAEARRQAPRDVGRDVAEALIVLNQNPPRIGIDVQAITVEELPE